MIGRFAIINANKKCQFEIETKYINLYYLLQHFSKNQYRSVVTVIERKKYG